MMKSTLAAAFGFLVMTLLAPPAHAQGYNAVFSADGVDVWAVGNQGSVLRSLDGGATWSASAVGAQSLHAIAARGFTALIAADSGQVWRSLDSGGSWSRTAFPGAPSILALQFPDDSVAFVAGAGGLMFKTANAGRTWSALASGTLAAIRALRFRDARHGWAVGDSGVAMHTDDGGATWRRNVLPTTVTLRSVDAFGATIWIAGDRGVLLKSVDGGAHWTALAMNVDPAPNLSRVWIENAGRVIVAGGGGFMRVTADSGASWSFLQHPLFAPISSMAFANAGRDGWAVSATAQTIEFTHDGGVTWTLAPGTSTAATPWIRRLAFTSTTTSVRGNTFAINALNPSTYFCVLGVTLFKSLDRGATWSEVGTLGFTNYSPNRTNSFWVSPRDSNLMVAATQEGPDMVMRSKDGGVTWNQSLPIDFSEYGPPLEMDPDHPDTLLFAPEDGNVYRSMDFGATWGILSSPGFRSPCDILIVPGDTQNVWVGDGVTGSGAGEIWQSTNGGLTFTKRYPLLGDHTATGSEVPSLSCPRLNPSLGFAAHWVTGGMSKTLDGGRTWTQMTSTFSAWGSDFARDDPTVAVFGVFGGAKAYQTFDAGLTFSTTPLASQNYAFLVPDRSTFFAQQGDGIYQFVPGYALSTSAAQSLSLTSPRGGESWAAGTAHDITWSATNVAVARIEYRANAAAPWTTIADVPGYASRFGWTVPDTATSSASVRVRDLWDASPADSSAAFTIATPRMTSSSSALAFGTRAVGSTALDTVRIVNPGTAPLVISTNVNAPGFQPTRSSIVIAPGASDTIGVRFVPQLPVYYAATLSLTSNASATPIQIALTGAASDTLHLALLSPVGGEEWQFGTTRWVQWRSATIQRVAIDIETAPGNWTALADSVVAASGKWSWVVSGGASATARVRVRDASGASMDSSAAPFALTVPSFGASPAALDLTTSASLSVSDTLHVANSGSAPLVVSWIASDRASFRPTRTFISLLPGAADSLGIVFSPARAGDDSATTTFTTNAAAHAHVTRVRGHVTPPLGTLPRANATFALEPALPNPVFETARIRYTLPSAADVALEIFNLQGERVATLARGVREAGVHDEIFRGRDANGARLPAGVYFCRLKASGEAASRKLLLMR
jgi:photosystem II stability/assembly factor-like uncharacterized protein